MGIFTLKAGEMAAVCRSTTDSLVIWQLWVKKKLQHLGPAHGEATWLHCLQHLSEADSDHSYLAKLQFRAALGPLFYLVNSFPFPDKIKLKQAEDEEQWKRTIPRV